MKLKREVNKLTTAKARYDTAVVELESKISDAVEFEFGIIYQPSDGFVILHVEGSHNAPLECCLDIIKGDGVLSYEEYQGICI